jgi:hypothetical protein
VSTASQKRWALPRTNACSRAGSMCLTLVYSAARDTSRRSVILSAAACSEGGSPSVTSIITLENSNSRGHCRCRCDSHTLSILLAGSARSSARRVITAAVACLPYLPTTCQMAFFPFLWLCKMKGVGSKDVARYGSKSLFAIFQGIIALERNRDAYETMKKS